MVLLSILNVLLGKKKVKWNIGNAASVYPVPNFCVCVCWDSTDSWNPDLRPMQHMATKHRGSAERPVDGTVVTPIPSSTLKVAFHPQHRFPKPSPLDPPSSVSLSRQLGPPPLDSRVVLCVVPPHCLSRGIVSKVIVTLLRLEHEHLKNKDHVLPEGTRAFSRWKHLC